MKTNAYGQPVIPKKDRRDQAREHARLMREEQQKRAKRRRWIWQGGVGVGLLAAAAIIALVVVNGTAPTSAVGPKNMASDGILLGGDGTTITAAPTKALAAGKKPIATNVDALTDTTNIVLYVDYLCPICGQFEAANAEQITTWVKAGNATLEVHPISILDQASAGSKYSTRSANAAACVANSAPDDFHAVNAALFAQQPEENTTGLTNAKLASLVSGAGVTSKKVADCITNGTFNDWVTASTKRALDGPIPNADIKNVGGTPTAIVNGKKYTGSISDAAAFEAFVTEQTAAAGTSDNTTE